MYSHRLRFIVILVTDFLLFLFGAAVIDFICGFKVAEGGVVAEGVVVADGICVAVFCA